MSSFSNLDIIIIRNIEYSDIIQMPTLNLSSFPNNLP